MKYAWSREHCGSLPVLAMCHVLEVSASGYYAWFDREPSPRARCTMLISAAAREVHAQSQSIYGEVKIAAALDTRDDLELACRYTVAQAMRDMGRKRRVY